MMIPTYSVFIPASAKFSDMPLPVKSMANMLRKSNPILAMTLELSKYSQIQRFLF